MTPTHLLTYVLSLQSKHHEAVGHLPPAALREYVQRDQIILDYENNQPCGYLLYYDGRNGNPPRSNPHHVRIYQCCVPDDARRILHGTTLINKLLQRIDPSRFAALTLWCATDLDSNAFWNALGFINDNLRIGGVKRGRLHNHWQYTIPAAGSDRSASLSRSLRGLRSLVSLRSAAHR